MILIALVDSFTDMYNPPNNAKTIEKQNSAEKSISVVLTLRSPFFPNYFINLTLRFQLRIIPPDSVLFNIFFLSEDAGLYSSSFFYRQAAVSIAVPPRTPAHNADRRR